MKLANGAGLKTWKGVAENWRWVGLGANGSFEQNPALSQRAIKGSGTMTHPVC